MLPSNLTLGELGELSGCAGVDRQPLPPEELLAWSGAGRAGWG